MKARQALAAVGLGCAALGCADAGGELPASSAQAIVGGVSSGAEQDGVVMLRAPLEGGSEVLCSASLVAPRLLVTARHCVSYLTEGVFSCSVRGELINNPEGGGRLGLHLPADSLEVWAGAPPRKAPLAHSQQIISTLSPSICTNDLAFVVLDVPLDLPVVPLRIGRPAEVDEPSVMVGYGMTKDGQAIDYRTQKRSQKRDLSITAVGPDSVEEGVTIVSPRSLIVNGPSGCVGDSGGPLLAQATGALLGVYSLLEGETCAGASARHHLVHVPPFTDLIDEAFAAADAQPTPEPSNEPGMAGGGAGGSPEADAGAPSALAGNGGAESEVTTTPDDSGAKKSSSCAFARPSSAADGYVAWALAALLLAAQRRRSRAR